ncbi:hypothetical protein PHYBOEH_008520 [Phytophthora boehmeriae]|uniref:Uncharacterized protein n=1 Tax=Phytophthora boehmeriae TaxID=109152 RepID=A0A8T1XEC3_9STRA|nr:hypothetical protein PHYBOEH_008520 [Phytophthora boehmeriae]
MAKADVEDTSEELLSAAQSAPTAPAVDRPAALLFSLQLYVDRVSLSATVKPPASSTDALLLAFQLLQYDIILFDTSLQCQDAAVSEEAVTELRHGKSCLFEADPDDLVRELQRERDAPLTLLLLTQQHGRARLGAFASVSLALHVGLLLESETDVLSSSLLHRVCEWASQSGRWELKDHHNQTVGHVDGAVTLSCLGKTLAPHLAHALGVQVSQSQPSSPCVQSPDAKLQTEQTVPRALVGDGAEEIRLGTEVAKEEVTKSEKEEEKAKMDSGVQCDEDMLLEVGTKVDPESMESDGNDGICLLGNYTEMRTRGQKPAAQRVKKASRANAERRRLSEGQSREYRPQTSTFKTELLFSRELPPPLFFQKKCR